MLLTVSCNVLMMNVSWAVHLLQNFTAKVLSNFSKLDSTRRYEKIVQIEKLEHVLCRIHFTVQCNGISREAKKMCTNFSHVRVRVQDRRYRGCMTDHVLSKVNSEKLTYGTYIPIDFHTRFAWPFFLSPNQHSIPIWFPFWGFRLYCMKSRPLFLLSTTTFVQRVLITDTVNDTHNSLWRYKEIHETTISARAWYAPIIIRTYVSVRIHDSRMKA
jgi:hypothetical protein